MKRGFMAVMTLLTVTASVRAEGIADIRASLANIVDQAYQTQATQNHIIALAARNKMLSQKIAKEAVKMQYGSDQEGARRRMMDAAQEFDATIEGLLKGDPSRHIPKVEDPRALAHLHEVVAVWQPFYRHVRQAKAADVAYIIAHNEKLLRLSHKLTQTLKNNMVISDTLNKVVEHTLKIADRQRMLTQKMLKEKLLIHYGVDPKRNEVRLKGSIILFENGLKGLLKGEKRRGLVKITNKRIHAKLEEIWDLWQQAAPLYRKSSLSDDEVRKLEQIEPQLLKKSDEVVTLVEKSLEL